MEHPAFPSPDTLLSEAEEVVRIVHDVYHEEWFRDLRHDEKLYGPPKGGRKATPYKPGLDAKPEQTRWESMAWQFEQQSPPVGAETLAELSRQQISYRQSELRGQLIRILAEVGEDRPSTVAEARAVIRRVLENLRVAKRCAALFASGRDTCSSILGKPQLWTEGIKSDASSEDMLYDIARQTGGKPWEMKFSFLTRFRASGNETRVARMGRSGVPNGVVGYYTARKTLAGTPEEPDVTLSIIDGGAYKIRLPHNHVGPNVDDILTADLLKHEWPLTAEEKRILGKHLHPHFVYSVPQKP